MNQEYYKKDEIKAHFDDFLENHDKDWIERNIDDIHHYAFNEDYYIIGTYQAKQWCTLTLLARKSYKNGWTCTMNWKGRLSDERRNSSHIKPIRFTQ